MTPWILRAVITRDRGYHGKGALECAWFLSMELSHERVSPPWPGEDYGAFRCMEVFQRPRLPCASVKAGCRYVWVKPWDTCENRNNRTLTKTVTVIIVGIPRFCGALTKSVTPT